MSKHLLPLAALFALALALRIWGIGFGLPHKTEDDCMIPYQVEVLYDAETEDPTAERNYNWYPLLLARVAALWPAPRPAPPQASLGEHLHAASQLHVRTRQTLAAIACLAVPLTWLLARLFLSAGWAYLAAALTATSLLHFSFSQQARPHAPSSALFLAAVLAGLWVRRGGRGWWPHLAAGATVLQAVGCLQSGVLCVVPVVLGYLLRGGDGRRLFRGRGDPLVVIPIAAAGLALALFYPFLWAGDFGQREDQPQVFDLAGHMIFLDQFNGQGFAVLWRTFWSYDPTLLVLSLAGLVLVLAVRARGPKPGLGVRGDGWIAASFWLPYLLVFGLYERNYERFMIALVPYAAVLGALGLARLAQLLGGGPRPGAPDRTRPVGAGLAVLALALPVWASWRLAAVRAAPDTLARAAAWVSEHLEPGQRGLMTSKVDLPLARTVEGLAYPLWGEPLPASRLHWFLPWSHYLGQLARDRGAQALPGPPATPRFDLHWLPVNVAAYLEDASGFIHKQGADYAVVEVFAEGRLAPAGPALTAGFRTGGELLVRISPDGRDDYSEHPFGYQDETSVKTPNVTARVLGARCTGPVIEIYRLANPGQAHPTAPGDAR